MQSYKRIFLTGGTGFAGKHLIHEISSLYTESEKVCLSRKVDNFTGNSWSVLEADMNDFDYIDKFIHDFMPDLVIHLAGQSSANNNDFSAENTWRNNFLATFNLASMLMKHNSCGAFLYVSSGLVYGNSFRLGMLDENSHVQPNNVYTRSKFAAENALTEILADTHKLVIARPVNHSGPGQLSTNFVIPSLIKQVVSIERGEKEPVLLTGDITKRRDFLDVRDVVGAYRKILESLHKFDKNTTLNISSGKSYAISEIIDILRHSSLVNFEVKTDISLLRQPGTDIDTISLDSSKLSTLTGWRPKFTLSETINSHLNEFREIN
jgi:GDP-4-dehydro-6-deoxy-D-mannose reductase